MTPEQMTAALVSEKQLSDAQRVALLDELAATADKISVLDLAQIKFGLQEIDLLQALARNVQRSADHIKLSQVAHQPDALSYVPARDAWDYLILPLEVEPDGALLCCTTDETLPTSLAYLMRSLDVPFHVVTSDVRPLEQYIAEQYHYEGIDDAA